MKPPAPRAIDLRLGTDLVEVAEVARSIDTFGERYLRRLFTDNELHYCLGSRCDPVPHLAARFAAKEATRKLLGQARHLDEGLGWKSVEVERHPDGSCDMVLHGEACALAKRQGVVALSVTMSHDGAYATAIVAGQAGLTGGRFACARTTPRGAYER